MTTVQTGDIPSGWGPGMGFGLGVAIVKDPVGALRYTSIGSYGHGGAYRTHTWADPEKDMITIVFYQRSNGGGDCADEISAVPATRRRRNRVTARRCRACTSPQCRRSATRTQTRKRRASPKPQRRDDNHPIPAYDSAAKVVRECTRSKTVPHAHSLPGRRGPQRHRGTAMRRISKYLFRLLRDHKGQDMVEYALLAGFIAVAAGALLPGLSDSISTIFSRMGSVLTEASGGGNTPTSTRNQ